MLGSPATLGSVPFHEYCKSRQAGMPVLQEKSETPNQSDKPETPAFGKDAQFQSGRRLPLYASCGKGDSSQSAPTGRIGSQFPCSSIPARSAERFAVRAASSPASDEWWPNARM